jgi:hypothetical protein
LLEANKAKYTMGPGGDWDTVKPVKVSVLKWTAPEIEMVMTDPGDPGDPLAIPPVPPVDPTYIQVVHSTLEMDVCLIDNVQRYADISLKTTTSNIVTQAFVEGTAPVETINVWPIPSQQGALVVYSQKSLDTIVDADTEIQLPEGYEDAIVYNLAKRLAPEFGKQLDPVVVQMASDSLADLKVKNSRPVLMRSDAVGMSDQNNKRGFNILNGYYR